MIRYRIALINVWWHQGDENQPYFNTVDEQIEYFNKLTANGAYFTPLVNFNMFDNIRTMITYRDTSNRVPEQLVACNYAIVEWYNADSDQKYYRYYYAFCSQDSGSQMRVELDLDDIQTNYFRFKDSFSDVFIRRAFINRYTVVDSNYYLNFWDERFWIDEELPPLVQYCWEKYGESIFPITPWSEFNSLTNNNNLAVFDFYKNYVIGWQVIFVSKNATLNYSNSPIAVAPRVCDYQIDHWRRDNFPTGTKASPFEAPFEIIAAPIYKRDENNPKMPVIILQDISGSHQVKLVNNLNFILSNPDNAPFIYSYQFTQHNFLVPYLRGNSGAVLDQGNELQCVINATFSGDLFTPQYQSSGGPQYPNEEDHTVVQRVSDGNNTGYIVGYTQPNKELLIGEVPPYLIRSNSIPKNTFKNTDVEYNPKMFASQFQCLKLEYYNGESITIDIMRLGKREQPNSVDYYSLLLFNWTEPLSTVINQSIITYFTPEYLSAFGNYTVNQYFRELSTISDFGLITTMDISLFFYTNNYSEYIANNKNYYTQRSYNLDKEFQQWAISSSANLIGSLGSGGSAILSSVGNSVFSAASLALKQEQTIKNSEWELDNMRGAPNSLKGSSSDVLGAAMRKRFGMRLTYWTIPERYLKRFNEFMNKYAYKIEEEMAGLNANTNMTIYDHNRKYWNYLECDVGTIYHSTDPLTGIKFLSNTEEERLKNALKYGVRFWNNPQIINGEAVSPVNYNQQNYELELDK